MSQSVQRTREQQRASQAWSDIQEVKEQLQEPAQKEYGSLARRVPTLVITNGLGQTLAYLKAKAKNEQSDHYGLMYRHLSRWTMGTVSPQGGDLLRWVQGEADSVTYRWATVEALAYLGWLKRFAEAELPRPE